MTEEAVTLDQKIKIKIKKILEIPVPELPGNSSLGISWTSGMPSQPDSWCTQ